MIALRGLCFDYLDASQHRVPALRGIDLSVAEGEAIALCGATGSGKTTLALHLPGLLRPSAGEVEVDGVAPWGVRGRRERARQLRELRRRVGLVFQYPEHQLFEDTVEAELGFGPRNLGLPPAEVAVRVEQAAAAVGLPSHLLKRCPFDLSGGEKRRVALAGVLAMRPRYLVLDEPTAALDPEGRKELTSLLEGLHHSGLALVVVTHDMEEAARLCGRVVVLEAGRVVADGPPRTVFALGAERLAAWGLEPPAITRVLSALRSRGLDVDISVQSLAEARDTILAALRQR